MLLRFKQPVTGEVSFPCPAGMDGLAVTLVTSQPGVAAVPASVPAAAGATSVTFSVTTRAVATTTDVVIMASFAGRTLSATLEVRPVPPPPPPPPAINLLVNGSFEEPDTSSSPIGWFTYGAAGLPGRPPAAPAIPGWKIAEGTVDVTSWYWKAIDGTQSLDLVGDNPGAIEQSFATEPGRDYLFSGWMAHNPQNLYLAEGRGNVFLNRLFLLQLVHQDARATVSDMRWAPFSVRFRATTSMTTLTIADATGTPFPGGLVLDGLSVAPAGGPSPAASATAPAAPTGLAVLLVGADRVTLTWIDNSSNEQAFAIWRKGGGADWARVGVVPPNTTTFTDTSLQRGTTYTYRVRATDQLASDWSNEVTVTTPVGL